ncbi:MAG: aconitate hydratase, partial [Lentisphaerae bacterium]|nr:aconitate hydratase [Lentisphaerota bacterium]
VFEGVDPTFAERAAKNRDAGVGNLIVAGDSYGQGSSREHAALCPMALGVKAVIAKSFERIHMANLVNFGIVPLLFENPADYEGVQQGARLAIAGAREALAGDGRAVVRNETQGGAFRVKTVLSEREKKLVLSGGVLQAAG